MRRRALTAVALLSLVLVACGDDDDDPSPTATTSSSTTSTATTASTTTSAPADDTEPAVLPASHGLVVGGTTFGFGTDDDVAGAVSAVLGEPTDESDIAECPAGPASGIRWQDELQIVLQEGAFVGWSIADGSTLVTDDGLAIGSTLQDVRDRYGDAVSVDPESTIGVELFVEGIGLSGLVTEDAPTGTVTALWAGTVCIFR